MKNILLKQLVGLIKADVFVKIRRKSNTADARDCSDVYFSMIEETMKVTANKIHVCTEKVTKIF